MICESLTKTEIYNQICFDINELEKSFDYKKMINDFRRFARRTKLTEVNCRLRNYTSKKFNNVWNIKPKLFINPKTKNIGLEINYYHITHGFRGCGIICYSPIPENKENLLGSKTIHKLCIFPQHFWDRYRERYSVNLSGKELIDNFWNNNSFACIKYKHRNDDEKEIMIMCTKGLCLGIIDKTNPNVYIIKTFISNDEMKNKQEDFFNFGNMNLEIENNLIMNF